ncbi:MAG: DUF3179 domain-containing protein [Chloroflexi bacterium]|nr:DUF3179 domain-containing protein [Chloroflexota bacterium]
MGIVLLSGCGVADSLSVDSEIPPTATVSAQSFSTPVPFPTQTPEPTPLPTEPKPTWIPTPSELPLGYEQSLPMDGIFPIYTPFFVGADEAPFDDEELVLGVAWGGEAKSYPITVLRFREMVNDEMASIPILVTY